MSDVKNDDGLLLWINLVNDPVVSDPYTVSALRCLQFLTAAREGITAQRFNGPHDSLKVPLADSADIMFHGTGRTTL